MVAQELIDAEAMRDFGVAVLRAVGVPRDHAVDSMEPLMWASLRGIETHGIRNLKPAYVDALAAGRIEPRPRFETEYETPVSARADGGGGLGLAASCWGMRLAIRKATDAGVGMVSMRNTEHFGAAGFYSHMAVAHGMIGVCMSGILYAKGIDRGMPPVFSDRPSLGTNPLSVAIPCGSEPAFVLDMSTTIVPVNRVQMMGEAGQSIPSGWCLDAEGNPTTDPAKAKVFLPLGGTREMGAHKGFGLAMVVETLSALLSAAWASPDGGSDFSQDAPAHFFAALRVDLFRKTEDFGAAMDAMVESLHAAPASPGHDRVYVPGEAEHELEQVRRREGIPLSDRVLEDLAELSRRYDVPLRLQGPR